MSRPSARCQVKLALDSITRLNASRHAAKAAGEAERWIFSHGTYNAYFDACIVFVRWAFAEYGIRELVKLRPEMVARYVELMRERGLAGTTIKTTLSALRKLGRGIQARWHRDLRMVPDDITASRGNPRFGYPLPLVEAMIEWLRLREPAIAVLVEVMYEAGLRIDEAVHLRWDKVDLEAGTVEVKGKGGAIRTVRLLDPEVLTRLPNRGHTWVFSPSPSQVRLAQEWIARAAHALGWEGEAGAHRLRASFAERFLMGQIEQGKTERQGREALSRELGHRRVDVTNRYVPRGVIDEVRSGCSWACTEAGGADEEG